jgi:hypothetical protein
MLRYMFLLVIQGDSMNLALIFSIPKTASNGYWWRWRSADGKVDSQRQFAYYSDCLRDAKAHGYSVKATDGDREHTQHEETLPVSFRA